MSLDEKIEFLKQKWDANKMAVISDAKNNPYICVINYDKKSKYFALSIELFNTSLERKGFINIFRDPNNRLFLSTLYIYYDCRGLKLATKINNLATFILKDEAGKIIRGRFFPYDTPHDTSIPKDLTLEEREFFTKKFYISNGYKILNYEDFKSAPENFPQLNRLDFEFGDNPAEKIVIKKLPKLSFYPFVEKNGFISEIEPDDNLEK